MRTIRHGKYIFLFSGFLISCQTKHLTETHNTPFFTKANQFEGGINLGLSGAQTNLAYTPIKYLSLQANGFTFSKPITTSTYFNNYVEGAIGTYYPFKSSCLALNVGLGAGSTNWSYDGVFGISGYTMYQAKFDSKNAFMHLYFTWQQDTFSIIKGVSFKSNFLTDNYYSARAEASILDVNKVPRNVQLFELTYFYKKRITKHLYYHFNVGVCVISHSESEAGRLIVRLGLVFR